MSSSSNKQPWYKNGMVWLAFSPAIAGVLTGLTLLTVGTINYDGTVNEDYYKEGRGINQSFDQDRLAQEKELEANLAFSDSKLEMNLTGKLTPFPDQLVVLMENATRSSLDFSIPVQHLGSGRYLGNLPQKIEYDWDVKLYGPQKEWRLYGRGHFPLQQPLNLLPSKR
ncbi:MAG: FixH family protein [Pseudomonadaceae bacterium]|nr:FixH family protein [Pseudomonadaceae bacterium]